jgi:hypothetical protein
MLSRTQIFTAIFVVLLAFTFGAATSDSYFQLCGGPSPHNDKLAEETQAAADPSAKALPAQKQPTAHADDKPAEERNSCSFVGLTLHAVHGFWEIKLTDVLLAIFTGLLAVYTRGLDKATRGLQDAALQQGKDMVASIKAAERSADIAENALRLSERPHIAIEEVGIGMLPHATEVVPFLWRLVNYGKGIGFVREYTIAVGIFESESKIETFDEAQLRDIIGKTPRITNWPIPPGHYFGFHVNDKSPGTVTMPIASQVEVAAGKAPCYAIGEFSYADSAGNIYNHRFIYSFDVRSQRFVPLRNDNWWKYT